MPKDNTGYISASPIFSLLRHIFGMQANNDEKEAQIAKAERNCQAYQQMLKEKDANIGELQKKVG